MMRHILNTLLLTMALSFAARAQTIKDNVHVSYKSTEAQADGMLGFLMGSMRMNVYLTPESGRVSVRMGGGSVKMDSYSVDGGRPVTLVQAMSRKMKLGENPIGRAFKPDFKYHKKETKRIAGYNCHKATVPTEDGGRVTLYVTPKIKVRPSDAMLDGMVDLSDLQGFPLQVEIATSKINLTLVAEGISKSVPDNVFQYDDTGFEVVDPADLGGRM